MVNLVVVLVRVGLLFDLGDSFNDVIESVAGVARVLSKLKGCGLFHVSLCLFEELFINRLLQVVI